MAQRTSSTVAGPALAGSAQVVLSDNFEDSELPASEATAADAPVVPAEILSSKNEIEENSVVAKQECEISKALPIDSVAACSIGSKSDMVLTPEAASTLPSDSLVTESFVVPNVSRDASTYSTSLRRLLLRSADSAVD